ncbi:MAG: type IV pilus assembly protein PilM [Deltaproteobacteria bacterium]|nr:type IV pilus assembly protein PilM [Deltaproteobacteria bacterium]MBW2077606.1 type IV pilus assembly protein PilM [Deltaproteobacteria bacterium]
MPVSKKNQLVGIDIGSHSIKVAEIEEGKQGMLLKNFGMIEIPSEAIVEGSIKEMEIVSSALKNLLKNLRIKNKNLATSISGYSVIVKKITIPQKGEEDLEESIQNEAEQYIPFDINDVNLDFQILTSEIKEEEEEEERESKEELMDVLLVAAKKDIVEEYISLFHLSELSPIVLDIDAFALQNAYEISNAEQTGCHALVHIGAQQLTINVVQEGVSIFTRDSSYGGAQITSEIQNKFETSYEEAEKIKLGATPVELDKKAVLEDIFSSTVTRWVQEIKRALDFVATTFVDIKVDDILLSGGSSLIPGFSKYLGMETGLKIDTLNPFANLEIKEKLFDAAYLNYCAPIAAISVGLALRSIGDR